MPRNVGLSTAIAIVLGSSFIKSSSDYNDDY